MGFYNKKIFSGGFAIMKLLKPLLVSILMAVAVPWLWNAAEAGTKTCPELVHPLYKQVDHILEQQAGLWDLFENAVQLQNHSILALRLDSKINALLFTLDYLCTTQEGIPYHEIANYSIPQIKEQGEEGFIEGQMGLGLSQQEAIDLVKFAKYAESTRHRKLDIGQIEKTMEQAGLLVKRYARLSEKIQKGSPASETVDEARAQLKDIEKLHATDTYLKQADYENAQIPHSSTLTGSADEM